jgi:ergothioneine biosynthesis protein EgtC
MCRFTLYLGPPIRMASLLTEPEHSLIRQSSHSTEMDEPLNGDGFGLGWYITDDGDEPAVFQSVRPAWNNANIDNLARAISSPCILAHVRAATNGIPVNHANCHPFRFGKYLFMHNGHVGAFAQIRRPLMESVCDEAFATIGGSTDSEHVFALYIDELLKSADDDQPLLMARLLARTIERTLELVREHGEEGAISKLNIAVSDGRQAVVSRFSDDGLDPPTLYFIEHELYEPAAKGSPARRRYECSNPVVVSSECLSDDAAWNSIPPNHLIVLERDKPWELFGIEGGRLVEAHVPSFATGS